MSAPRWQRRLVKLGIAAAIALGVAQAEVAIQCRRPAPSGATTEQCLWGRAYLPLTRTLYVLLGAPILYGLFTLAEHALRGRRGPER